MAKVEADVRHRIDNQLRNLGWSFEGDANVMLEGNCKTPEQKKSLGRKRPDYILYESKSTHPLAIIEAKKAGKDLDAALIQGGEYARAVGAKFVFASDSFVVRVKTVDGIVPTINDDFVSHFLTESVLLKLESNPHLETESATIKSKGELIKLFNKAEKYLRNDGIDAGMDCIYEFCTILFMKIMSESSDKIPAQYSWDSLVEYRGERLYHHYKETVKYFKEKYTDIFREVKIKTPSVLEQILDSLKGIKLSDVDIDIKGEAYEHFLKRYSTQNKSVLGQHFTPRHIIEMMVLLLNPQVDEKTYDPFCGTGGMLLACYKEMIRNIRDENEIEKLKQESLYGNDISYGTSQIAKMNMVLVGDGHSNITNFDSLKNNTSGTYNSVITNIPFNLEQQDSNGLCVRHCFDSIMKGGRACIIVPENLAYDNAHKSIREYIVNNSTIEAVIRLPRHTFKSYTDARTCILWLSNIWRGKTSAFAYIEIKNDGFSSSRWREPIDGSDIPNILENKSDLKAIYEVQTIQDDFKFFETISDFGYVGDYKLGDLLIVKDEKIKLDPNKEYREPRLCSETNTISTRQTRLGKNIKVSEKIMINAGDLVIATLHTQSGNGLFAISDGDYIATSQVVAKIRTDLISAEYLKLVLQNILPKLQTSDLVGRETYKVADILSLPIPAEPKGFQKDMEKIANLENEREILARKIRKIKDKYKL